MNSPETPEATAQEMSAVGRIINVFTSPRKAFESVDANPSWLLPFILILLISVVFILTAQDIIVNDTIAQQESAMLERGTDPEQNQRE